MLDIKKFQATETTEVELTDGNDSPIEDDKGNRASITICGPGSKTWRRADAEKRRKATSRVDKAKGKLTAAVDPDGVDEAEFLADITVSFNNFEYPAPEGQTWSSKREMFLECYKDPSVGFIRKQIEDASDDWALFSKGSGKN